MENMDINFSGKLTSKEFRKVRYYQLRTIFLFLYFLLVVLNYLNFERNTPWINALILSLLQTIGLFILIKIITVIFYSIQYRTDPMLKNERQFSIDNDGVHINTKNSKLFYGWSEFRSIHEHKKCICLIFQHYEQ